MANNISFSRYSGMVNDGDQSTVPFIKLDIKSTDKTIVWKSNESKMFKLSSDYYSGNPTYGWLILLANGIFTMEYDIPHNTLIRIPYPLQDTLKEYTEKMNNFSKNN